MPSPADAESASRHYEIAVLVHPGQSEQVPEMMSRYRKIVKAHGGEVHREEDWGRRTLAYAIGNLSKAHYVLMNVEGSPAMLAELKSTLRYNDAVLRELTVRRRRAISEQSPIMRETLKERARERNGRDERARERNGRDAAESRRRGKAGGDSAEGARAPEPARAPSDG